MKIARSMKSPSAHPGIRRRDRTHRAPTSIYYSILSSPLGKIGIAATRHGICRISLNETSLASFRDKILKDSSGTLIPNGIPNGKFFKTLAPKMRRYFSGRRLESQNSIDLLGGTPFQQRVWRALQSIPYGQTRSYRSIAESIGHPKSSRAVGSACGRNPIPILIPCHRVVRHDGRLGGFTGGIHLKRYLLTLEGSRPLVKSM